MKLSTRVKRFFGTFLPAREIHINKDRAGDATRHHHHARVVEVVVFHSDDPDRAGEADYIFVNWEQLDSEPCDCKEVADPWVMV